MRNGFALFGLLVISPEDKRVLDSGVSSLAWKGVSPRRLKAWGSEVMIERNVLLKNNYDVLDRRLCRGIATLLCVCWVDGQQRHGRSGHSRQSLSKAVMHRMSLLGISVLNRNWKHRGRRTHEDTQTRGRRSPFFLRKNF